MIHQKLQKSILLFIFLVTHSILNHIITIVQSKSCIPIQDDHYLCTDDPSKLRAAVAESTKGNPSAYSYYSSDGRIPDSFFGVEQRMDGNEDEVAAVKVILDDMYDYFDTEVLVLPEYESVRETCKNQYDLCAFWASIGECEANRGFMVSHCAPTCRLCLHLHSSFDEL